MRHMSKLIPSPAMIVAILALIVATSGVAYAAGTINGKVIKKRSISGAKLKKHTVTGTEIKLSKLGKVPVAASADNAAHATTATNATNSDTTSVVSFQATKGVDAAADLASAPQVALGSNGPFSFYGKCYLTGAGRVEATTFIASTTDTGMFDTEAEDSGYVTAATPEANRKLQDVTTSGVNTFKAGDGDKDFMATDGTKSFYGILGLAAAKEGTPAAGNGPFGAGNRCLFGGVNFG